MIENTDEDTAEDNTEHVMKMQTMVKMMMRPGILRIQRIMQTQITITAQMHPKKVQRTHPQTVTVLLTAAVQESSVVNYATQVCRKSLTYGAEQALPNGADCSGFVQSVYANFGVSLPRTSYEQQNAGTEVSYADAQPGDLICYGGHVAIYMGNGQIVHASNSQDGIKISNDATYRTIVSVRRLV